jgi:hypothetical protein
MRWPLARFRLQRVLDFSTGRGVLPTPLMLF